MDKDESMIGAAGVHLRSVMANDGPNDPGMLKPGPIIEFDSITAKNNCKLRLG